jgi:lipoprotein-anchoring transpeptidase ErfK/SrfK
MKKLILIFLFLFVFIPMGWAQDVAQEPRTEEIDLTGNNAPASGTQPSVQPAELPSLPSTDLESQPAASEPSPTVVPSYPAPAETPSSYSSDTLSSGLSSIQEAKQFISAGDFKSAKGILDPQVGLLTGSDRDAALDVLAEANFKLLQAGELPGLSEYVVKPGDSLYVIAKKYKTTPGMIQQLNQMKNTVIRPDQKLKILSAPYSIKVSKAKNRLELYIGSDAIRTYSVSTGTNNSTPVGTFTITTKLENPTWYKTGAVVPAGNKENILGTRWLGFSLIGYGIHGTTQPELIGTQATAGCIRMKNQDVEELYGMVPSGTSVTIEN